MNRLDLRVLKAKNGFLVIDQGNSSAIPGHSSTAFDYVALTPQALGELIEDLALATIEPTPKKCESCQK
jgi:hypothetical protein